MQNAASLPFLFLRGSTGQHLHGILARIAIVPFLSLRYGLLVGLEDGLVAILTSEDSRHNLLNVHKTEY